MGSISKVLSTIIQLGPLAVLAVLYARRTRALRRGGQSVAGWRQACFHGSLAVIAAALAGLGKASQELLALHMVEHLLIGDIASLLFVLGLTGPVLAPVLRVSVFNRLRVLSKPSIALPLWAADLYLWHLPVLYQAALRSDGVHALEHAAFFACGVNLWMCLLGPLPVPSWFTGSRRALYVLGYWFAGTLLANVFIWVGSVFYPFYTAGEASWQLPALTDQRLAGGTMMIECSVLTLCLGSWLFTSALREAGERQALLDFARSRGLELSEERAGRAVRAGRGAALRSRLENGATGSVGAPAGPQRG